MATEGLAKYKEQWSQMDPKFKYGIIAIVIAGGIMVYFNGKEHDRILAEQEAASKAKSEAAAAAANANPAGGGMRLTAMPTTFRNQGLEDLIAELDKTREEARTSKETANSAQTVVQKMEDRIKQLENGRTGAAYGGVGSSGGQSQSGNRDGVGSFSDGLPPPVDFAQPGSDARQQGAVPGKPGVGSGAGVIDFGTPGDNVAVKPAARTAMKTWAAESEPASAKKNGPRLPALTLPKNSGIEAVMLSGINARSNASSGAAVGSILSANNVGAPFVTRVKGDVILPNGWRVSNFADCFVNGNGVAVLSTERANVIADSISCVDRKGRIFEAPIKAYGLDLDGIQGLTGRVVTKQGSLLAKTALAGVASGLGTALTPQQLPGYNSNQQSGSTQGVVYPNLNLVGQTALGSGVAEGAKALSKFYLDYAKEMFPVVEVKAGTRVTWILQETVELSQPSDKP